MITIHNVTQAELQAVLAEVKASGKALVNPSATNPLAGEITAAYWPLHIKAEYSLASDGTLTVTANELEGQIASQLGTELLSLRAKGI